MRNISEVVMNHVLLSSLLVTFVLAFLSAKRPHSSFLVMAIEVVNLS